MKEKVLLNGHILRDDGGDLCPHCMTRLNQLEIPSAWPGDNPESWIIHGVCWNCSDENGMMVVGNNRVKHKEKQNA